MTKTATIIDPYRRNCEIIRSFFAKPIVLLIAVACSLEVIFKLSLGFIGSKPNSLLSFNFDVFSTLLAIAFFLLYFRSKRNPSYVSYKAPFVLIRIVMILQLICCTLAFILILLFIAFGSSLGNVFGTSLTLATYFLPLLIIDILKSVGILILISSFKKCTTTIYLTSAGSLLSGISYIAYCIYSSVIAVLSVLIFPQMIQSIYDAIMLSLQNYNIQGLQAVQYVAPSTTTIISSALDFIVCILFGIFAISFYKYINKITNDIVVNTRPKETSNNTLFNEAESTPVTPNESIKNFTPQSVFGIDENTTTAIIANSKETIDNKPDVESKITGNLNLQHHQEPLEDIQIASDINSDTHSYKQVLFNENPYADKASQLNDNVIKNSEDNINDSDEDKTKSQPLSDIAENNEPLVAIPTKVATQTCPACGAKLDIDKTICDNCGCILK